MEVERGFSYSRYILKIEKTGFAEREKEIEESRAFVLYRCKIEAGIN